MSYIRPQPSTPDLSMPLSFATYDTSPVRDLYTEQVVDRVVARLREDGTLPDDNAWLAPAAAAAYLGVGRRRIYDLRSIGAISPDGFDGRTPLFTRATLDT